MYNIAAVKRKTKKQTNKQNKYCTDVAYGFDHAVHYDYDYDID